MTRRTLVLAGILVVCGGGWLATGPSLPPMFQRKLPLPTDAASRIQDSGGALDAARAEIEAAVRRFGSELGIDLRVVTTSGAKDPAAFAASLVADPERDGWTPTGSIVVVLDAKVGRVFLAASEPLVQHLPAAVVEEKLAARVGPFLGDPLGAVAIASGLGRIRDHLLALAADGALVLDDLVANRSIAMRVAASRAALAMRCRAPVADAHADPAASAEAFLCALAHGSTSSSPALFTAASAFHLTRRPLPPFESRARASALDAARPWSVVVTEDRAAVLPTARHGDAQPVLLQRIGEAWRIDLVEMEKTFRATGAGRWQRRLQGGPYWLALAALPTKGALDTYLGPVELWGAPIEDVVADLEQSDDPAAKLRLAEILLRNAWLPGEALVRWDEALALAPDDVQDANLFADRTELLGYPLLGAFALAPHGPPVMSRVAELTLRGGKIDTGMAFLRRAIEWRKARNAIRAALRRPSAESI